MIQGDRVTFGRKYRDRILEIEGVATAQCSYITGCDHVLLEWMRDGKHDDHWVDILRLERVVSSSPVESVSAPKTGGPAPHPPSRSHG